MIPDDDDSEELDFSQENPLYPSPPLPPEGPHRVRAVLEWLARWRENVKTGWSEYRWSRRMMKEEQRKEKGGGSR